MDESSRKEIEMLVQNYTEKPVAELDAILVKLSEYPERLIEDAVAKIETEKDQRIRQDLLF
jgi:F0F1-type ATP synthase membrane subunit b/b'